MTVPSERLRDLLAAAMYLDHDETDRVFATRIPWTCPDCHGEGRTRCGWGDEYHQGPSQCRLCKVCTHPNAPTVGAWLAAAPAVRDCIAAVPAAASWAELDATLDHIWSIVAPGTDRP